MKHVRIISILTAVVLLTACCVIPASATLPPQIYLFGDVNFDDELTVSDATDVQQAAAEMVEFDIYKSKTADINHDGFVTVADATLIQMVAACNRCRRDVNSNGCRGNGNPRGLRRIY